MFDFVFYGILVAGVCYVAYVLDTDDEGPNTCGFCHTKYERSMNSHFCIDEDWTEW